MNSASVPAMLVPAKMFAQSNITLQDGSIVNAIPINPGSILIESAAKVGESVRNKSLSGADMVIEPETPDVKTSTKGRRPKSLATEMKSGFDLGMGMITDRPMCRACGKYFMSRQQLNQHMLVHTDIRKYKCTYCERTFKQPSHLHQHHRIHTGEKPYRCPIPGCLRAFPQQSNLNHHLRNHDKPAPPPENTCSLCMRAYASETVLRSHIAKIHMCDPETLLGARKKSQTKDLSRQQHGDSTSTDTYISSSSQLLKPEKLCGTFSNSPCDKNNVISKSVLENPINSLESSYLVRKPDTAVYFQNLSFMPNNNSSVTSWANGSYSSQSQILEKFKVINDYEAAVSEGDSCRRTVPEKNGQPFSDTLDKPDEGLMHHFVATTTSRRAIHEFASADRENMNGTVGKANSTGMDLSASSDSSPSALTQSVDHGGLNSDTKTSAESLPSHASRSRKRKAFQPQRIVQKLEVNEEQEYIY